MNRLRNIISDNSGKTFVTIVIIVLGAIILAALALWVLIIFGHFWQINPYDVMGEKIGTAVSNISVSIQETAEEWRAEREARRAEREGEEDDEDGEVGETPPAVPATTPAATPPPTPTPNPISPPYHGTPRPGTVFEPPSEITTAAISESYPGIQEMLDAIAARFDCAAVSLAVYDGNTMEHYTYEYGFADISEDRLTQTDTKFRVASLSKLVTAMCAMTLVDSGYLDLDTDVSVYFGYELRNIHFPDTPITARMLLQHTSSIFDSGAFQVSRDKGSSESVRYLMERGTSFRRSNPGTNFEYTDFGYAVLGSLCERVSGKTIDALARDAILRPLGIDAAFVPDRLQDTDSIGIIYDSGHEVSRSVASQLAVEQSDTLGHDLHLAQGNLTISAADYAKILSVLGNNGVYLGEHILSAASVREMHRTNVEGVGYMQGLATRYSAIVDNGPLPSGNAGILPDDGFYWHTGSAYGMYSQYIYTTGSNRGVAVITTGASVSRLSNGMVDACTELSQAALGVFGPAGTGGMEQSVG